MKKKILDPDKNVRLKNIRNSLMLSKRDFAELLDVGEQAYAKYENGDRDISFVCDKIIHLGINYNWIVTGNGPMFLKEKIYVNKNKSMAMVVADIDPESIYNKEHTRLQEINEILKDHPKLEDHIYYYLKSLISKPDI